MFFPLVTLVNAYFQSVSAMFDLLTRSLPKLDLPLNTSFDSCLEKRIESYHSDSGTTRLFFLNEKLGEIHIITESSGVAKPFESTFLLTPLPTVSFRSLLVSPSGSLLALCTNTSVHVLDTFRSPLPEQPHGGSVKSIYCAFDTLDHGDVHKMRSTICRVRWHPLHKDTLVILTTTSDVFFVKCEQLNSPTVIQCRITVELNLSEICRRQNDTARSADLTNSDQSDDESQSANFYPHSMRLDLVEVLGLNVVDFDFGSLVPLENVGAQSDSSLYFLCETGYVLQVSGCLSTTLKRNSSVRVQSLQILPQTMDNYGEDFCSILCISSTLSDKQQKGSMNSVEVSPDILILANRAGRLLQGVVLHSVLLGSRLDKRHSAKSTPPSLCIVDTVELQLSNQAVGEQDAQFAQPDASIPSLVLEPSHGLPSVGQYACMSYYAIHDSGIHFVRLPWLHLLSERCEQVLEDPLLDPSPSETNGPSAWRSSVVHLVCARLPTTTSPSIRVDGGFRLVGLVESDARTTQPCAHIVLAPTVKGGESSQQLVHTIPFSHVRDGSHEKLKLTGSSLIGSSVTFVRSEFAAQLRRIIRQDDLYLPHISALSLQPNVNHLQAVHFFIKMTEMLRSGSLDRLIQARTFVEQYTERLNRVLSEQYSAALDLTASRKMLQASAERLTKRHAAVLDRQQALERRLAILASRLSGLADGPFKADIAMHDEVQHLSDRTQLALKKWLREVLSKRALLKERLVSLCPQNVTSTMVLNGTRIDHTQLKQLSQILQRETIQIKQLVEATKNLNAASSDSVAT